jgi:hypothetical protein
LLDLHARIVISVPDQLPPWHQFSEITRQLNMPIAYKFVQKNDTPDFPRRSLDGVEMKVRAGPPSPKGFIVTGRKKNP